MKSALSSRSIFLSLVRPLKIHTAPRSARRSRGAVVMHSAAAAVQREKERLGRERECGRAAHLREWQGACVPIARGCKGRGCLSVELALSRDRRLAPISSQLPLRGLSSDAPPRQTRQTKGALMPPPPPARCRF